MAHILYGVERPGQIQLTYGRDGLELSFTEIYRVRADSKTATMWEVMKDATTEDEDVEALLGTNNGDPSTGLPLPGLTIDRDSICRCRSLSGERLEQNPFEWEFTGQWSSKVQDGRGGISQDGDPTVPLESVIPIRETLYEPIRRQNPGRDQKGNFFINGAGDLLTEGVETEEELPRWDFAQFDRNYEGEVSGFYDTYAGLSGTYAVLTKPDYIRAGTPWVWAPGVYFNNAGTWVFFAPTDATVFYMNGCVNMVSWLGYDPFTLLLRVRSSRVGYYNGQRKRLTEFSVIYDKQNWWHKVTNAGPNFIAPKLDANGNNVAGQWETYPYIYFRESTETNDTDLVLQQQGLLTFDTTAFPSVNPFVITTNDTATANNWEASSPFLRAGGSPVNNYGAPISGLVKVTQADGKKTWRANRPDRTVEPSMIEFVNHEILPFAGYLRPTLTGPYIPVP